MASTGKKHKVKGKTLNLNDFLGTDQDAPTGYAVVNTRRLNWADTMENEVVDAEKYTIDYKKDEKIILPTAPKAARGPDVDMSRVPNKPPYTVYLGNLPYDVSEEDVIKFFRQLKVSSVRLPRESGERGRMRGFGYAEFPDRGTLLEALAYNNESLKNRSIKVSLAEEHDNEGRERGNRDMGRSERTLGGDWRAMSRDDDDDRRQEPSFGSGRGFDDSDGGYRRGGSSSFGTSFGRDSDRDGGDRDFGRFQRDRRGFGDRDQGYDRGPDRRMGSGGGYERRGDYDRGYGSGSGSGGWRENSSASRDDRNSDRDHSFGGGSGGGGWRENSSASRNDRIAEREHESGGPRERKKLQLKPRSVPVEAAKEVAPAPAAPAPKASAAIFGGARPVDTAAREREIEERLARQREEEERKQVVVREPFVDRKDERVRRSSVGSGSGRSRRSSESGGRESYDEGAKQPLSRQYSNDSDQQYSGSQGGRQDAPASLKGDQGDSSKRPSKRWAEPGGAKDSHSNRNGGEKVLCKLEHSAGRDEEVKEVVYTSKNIYAHLQDEEGDDVSD